MAQRRRRDQRRAQPPAEDVSARRRRGSPGGPRKLSPKLLIPLAALLVAIAVGVIVNYLVSVKAPGDAPILQVNNRVFKWREYVDLLKSQKLGAEAFGGSFNAGVAPYQLMQTLAENELIKQAAAREGLRVTGEDIRAEMIDRLLDDADTQGDPGQISRELDVALAQDLAITQLSKSQYEDIIRVDLLRNQLRDKLGAQVPQVQPHAFVHMIRVSDPEVIEQVQQRLDEGEEFSRVARQLSADEETRLAGGEVGWVPRLVFQNLDLFLFGLEVNEVSNPVAVEDGVYVIKMIEPMGESAHLKAFKVASGGEARDAVRRLETGLTFEDLAAQVSIDPDLRAKRGDLGIVSVGDYGGAFDILIRGMALGEVSEPLSDLSDNIFLMVSDRTPAREMREENLTTLKTRALEAWLRREWDVNFITYCPGGDDDCFSNVKVDKALGDIGDVSRTKFEQAATATAQARRQPQQPFPF